MGYTTVGEADFAALDEMGNWTFDDGAIRASFTAPSFTAAAQLAAEVAAVADAADHHPDMAIRYPGRLEVVLTTHAAGSLTTLDVDVARRVDDLAVRAGAVAD